MSNSMKNLEIYKCGGAVRDALLGVNPNDTDYVVINSSEKEMLSLGFTRVGLSFPVFLHPETRDEYALARKEIKTGLGHTSFDTETEGVTLLQDLYRRDFTMNSIAYDEETGEYIDPYNGRADILKKVIRHTSEAFKEDPLRILRLARFRCQFGAEWKIHSTTKALVYTMSSTLRDLTPERVWKEVEKALLLPNSHIFFETLLELGVLEDLFPNIFQLVTLREGSPYHQESSCFEHTMMAMKLLADDANVETKLGVLYHDIAKPYTYRVYGNSAGHDDIALISERIDMPIPTSILKKVLFFAENHIRIYRLHEMTEKKQVKFFKSFKGNRKLLDNLITISDCDNEGRISTNYASLPKKEIIEAFERISAYSPSQWILKQETQPNGDQIQQHISKECIKIVKEVNIPKYSPAELQFSPSERVTKLLEELSEEEEKFNEMLVELRKRT